MKLNRTYIMPCLEITYLIDNVLDRMFPPTPVVKFQVITEAAIIGAAPRCHKAYLPPPVRQHGNAPFKVIYEAPVRFIFIEFAYERSSRIYYKFSFFLITYAARAFQIFTLRKAIRQF